MATHSAAREVDTEIPRGTLANLARFARHDLLSGFLVFLIALPLCLAISLASGYPAIAGVFTAIVGGIIGTAVSNSELTIKGPAAGLIVIAIGCVTEFGFTGGADPAADLAAYRLALGVGVAAACMQIALALLRTGVLGEFFPTAAVHGMLAAIGVIIIAKQVPVAVGLRASGEPLELLLEVPDNVLHMNPEIGLIGFVSLAILFGKPLFSNRFIKMIPGPMLVLAVAVPMGLYFNLEEYHTYTFNGEQYAVGEQHLVNVPFNLFSAITFPDFSGLAHGFAWKWALMYALIGSLESLLSAKAIDLLDPWKRKTNLNRDTLAVGIGNLAAASIGGLPMISEIVRSRANIDNGARTRFANLFHGLFLLLCVSLLPALIHRIPLAALAAMLVYTGFRLAHPREFIHAFKVGPEQFLVYVTTIIAVLATDLLVGIAIGIAVEFLVHFVSGMPLLSFVRPSLKVEENGDDTCRIKVLHFAIFSNWILLRRRIIQGGLQQRKHVELDLSETWLVDHTVMEKLHELERDFKTEGLQLNINGLENHRPVSAHPHSTRKRSWETPNR
jgi:MFS superfamily sulfate permease-like transporter